MSDLSQKALLSGLSILINKPTNDKCRLIFIVHIKTEGLIKTIATLASLAVTYSTQNNQLMQIRRLLYAQISSPLPVILESKSFTDKDCKDRFKWSINLKANKRTNQSDRDNLISLQI